MRYCLKEVCYCLQSCASWYPCASWRQSITFGSRGSKKNICEAYLILLNGQRRPRFQLYDRTRRRGWFWQWGLQFFSFGKVALPSNASTVDLDGVESEKQDSECESVIGKINKKLKKMQRKKVNMAWTAREWYNKCSNDYLVKKLVFQNTKSSSNGELFKKVVADSQKACLERGHNFEFDITQTRTKFKSCVSLCETAAMTAKTATGIQRFQDDKNLGRWFNQLFPLVESRESAQPEQAIEPSAPQEVALDENYDKTQPMVLTSKVIHNHHVLQTQFPVLTKECLERNPPPPKKILQLQWRHARRREVISGDF